MAYKQKGHYGQYSGNAKHSRHHMTNSWEEQDVKRGKEQMKEGHKGHAEALFDDAHGSYNYDGKNSTGAERNDSPANFGFSLGAVASMVGGGRKRGGRRHDEIITKLDSIESQLGGDDAGATTNSQDAVLGGSMAQAAANGSMMDMENPANLAMNPNVPRTNPARGTLPVTGDLANPMG